MAVAMLAAGCGNREKDATEAAISAAQSAINAVREQAEKYVPEQLQAAEKTLQSARDALAKGDYEKALAGTRDAAKRAKEMAEAAVGKKEEWARTWKELNESLSKTMAQVNGKLDAYSRGARMPEGMDKGALEEAKKQYAELKQKWAEAVSSANTGDLREAIRKGTDVKELLEKLKEMLGIKTENKK